MLTAVNLFRLSAHKVHNIAVLVFSDEPIPNNIVSHAVFYNAPNVMICVIAWNRQDR